ncbi:sce7725 family protein [Proteus mirabilis]|nr:sce7725 family protein [Proteus mirabilis]
MYFPFIRGKQFELNALRELAPLLNNKIYKPIIEPVRKNLLPLVRTIKELNENNIIPIIIINPNLGDFENECINLIIKLSSMDNKIKFIPCVKIADNTINYSLVLNELPTVNAIFIADILEKKHFQYLNRSTYAIIPKQTVDDELYQLKNNIILIDDPFQKKTRNADYKERSSFSNLHINYLTRPNVIGFSDYAIVGAEYSEAGGPAYVVTIHLSYIEKDYNQMFIRHFSSEKSNSPANPGGKFHEALARYINFINSYPNTFDNTLGTRELAYLYNEKHFPGLGQLKKISIEHHIETLCNYLSSNIEVDK